MFQSIENSTLLWTFFIITSSYLIFKYAIKPYRQLRYYAKLLKAQDLKVLVQPFSILGLGTYGQLKKDYQTHGDSQYTFKTDCRNYQLSLSSFKRVIFLDFYDPELIKEFYEKQAQGYYIKSLNNPFITSLRSLIGNGLVFSEGNQWKMKRKIMSSLFNHQFIKSKIPSIAQICQYKIKAIEELPENVGNEQINLNIPNFLQQIFGNVVVKCFFGDIKLQTLDGEQLFIYIDKMFQKNTDRVFSKLTFLLGNNFYKYNLRSIDREVSKRNIKFQQFARNTIFQQIKYHQNNQVKDTDKYTSIIQMLVKQNRLRNVPKNQQDQNRDYYTIQDLIDEFKTFFSAGIDTTTNSTSFLIYILSQNPQVEAKLRQEIEQAFPEPFEFSSITYEKVKQLSYLENVLKENLRMYGPSAGIFSRQALKDHYIGKIPVKRGMLLSVKLKPNQFKEKFYVNPMEFIPERWQKNDPSKKEPFSYFPFSFGGRNCIGQHLASIQAKIAIISILKKYKTIILEKPNFKKHMKTTYAAEEMNTTLIKSSR